MALLLSKKAINEKARTSSDPFPTKTFSLDKELSAAITSLNLSVVGEG